jgi:hypothetical protein
LGLPPSPFRTAAQNPACSAFVSPYLPDFFSREKVKDSDDGATDGPTPKVAATSFSASFDIWPEGVMPVHAGRRQSVGRQGSGPELGMNLCEHPSYESFL